MTKSGDVEVIKAAITALGELRDSHYSGNIQPFLIHPDWGVRACCVKAIGQLKDLSAKKKLEQMMTQDPDRLVRQSAQFALTQLAEH